MISNKRDATVQKFLYSKNELLVKYSYLCRPFTNSSEWCAVVKRLKTSMFSHAYSKKVKN